LPLDDRDYMKPSPPPVRRRLWSGGSNSGFSLNPVLTIIIVNLVLYLATAFSGEGLYQLGPYMQISADRFTYYLGLIPHYFTSRPWTILTSVFIHSSFGHIFGNMLTLYFFGNFLARMVGNTKFLLVYFIGGIAGNAVYLLLGQSFSLLIGASGAVYAIAGALVVMFPKLPVRLYFIIPVPLWVLVLIFFVAWSFIPGVAWQAHMGGMAVGLIAGFFFRRKMVPLVYYR
jgi:membrane associated rhomboid family serine protease